MPNAVKSVVALFAIGAMLTCGALASEFDITSYNTLQTASPATIAKVEVLEPSFKFRYIVLQSCGGLNIPRISFTVINRSPVAISKVYLSGVLKAQGRSVPLAAQDFNLSIPGGIQPGEQKHFDLEATSYGDWSNVTKREVRNADFVLTLNAVDDAGGARIVK
jgi:hypothetical protein